MGVEMFTERENSSRWWIWNRESHTVSSCCFTNSSRWRRPNPFILLTITELLLVMTDFFARAGAASWVHCLQTRRANFKAATGRWLKMQFKIWKFIKVLLNYCYYCLLLVINFCILTMWLVRQSTLDSWFTFGLAPNARRTAFKSLDLPFW